MTPSGVQVRACARTDIGNVRDRNEDFVVAGDLDSGERWPWEQSVELVVGARGPLWVVCDGMGGAAAGDVASELAAVVVWAEMRESAATAEPVVLARQLRRAVRVANRRVREQGRREAPLRGMGTTLSAAALAGSTVLLAQVGDSRAYLLRAGALVQLTRDQSVASALVHAGGMTAEEAANVPGAHAILQALGTADDVEVALSTAELRCGDRLLLCTDGLYGPLGDDVITELLVAAQEPSAAAEALLAAARARGGPDNITAVVTFWQGDGLLPPRPEEPPRFVELDPMEEGQRALTTTSRVARRLAARIGLVDDPGGPAVPGTRRLLALGDEPVTREPAAGDLTGPAARALAERERLGLLSWTLAVVATLLVAAIILWDAFR